MILTHADIIAAEREYCKRSLANFARRAWPVLEPASELKWGWVLDAICEHLESVTAGDINRLLMNVPPGSMKSLLVGVMWPAWEWGARDMPHIRYLGTAHKQDLAVRDSTKFRRLIQSDWYQSLWPIELAGDQNAKTKLENNKTGFREAMSFTSLTGSRGDRVGIDDPHSVEDANSKVKLAADVKNFREAVPSRVNNSKSAIIIIMQRLAVGDVSDVAVELGYQHLKIPMRYEKGKSCWVVGKGDPRTEEGELMFPERFSEKEVRELELSLGTHATAGQLQQRPNVIGGEIIKGDQFQRYRVPPRIKYRTIYADTAQKTKERNDYSVFECWGMGEDGRIYLLDMIRGKWEAPALRQNAIDFWNKCKAVQGLGALREMKVEDKASGTGLIQDLKRAPLRIPIKPIPRAIDKLTRVMDATPHIEAGNVCLPEEAEYVSAFIGECEAFTADDTHAHDDQIDPMCDAISDMLTKRGGFFADV